MKENIEYSEINDTLKMISHKVDEMVTEIMILRVENKRLSDINEGLQIEYNRVIKESQPINVADL